MYTYSVPINSGNNGSRHRVECFPHKILSSRVNVAKQDEQ